MSRLSEINVRTYLNSEFEASFLVKEVKSGKQKNGNMFLSVIMKDRDIEVEAKFFNAGQDVINFITPGKIIKAVVKVQEYDKAKDGISCILESVGDDDTGYNVADFIDVIDNYDSYINKFRELLTYTSDTLYGKIAYHIINKYWGKYQVWVAGKSQHHNAMGGLLMHSVCVAECSKEMGEFYNRVYGPDFCNIKLLVAVGLMHDVMKTTELVYKANDGTVEYNQENLSSHIVDAALEIEKAAIELNIQERYIVEEMKHCVLAHHGKMEWGSPVTPYFPEAFIISKVDEMDAECWKFNKKFKEMKEHEKKVEWVGGECKIYYKPTIANTTEI